VQVELSSLLRVGVSCDVRLLLDGVELCWPATVQRCKAAQFGLDERGQKVLLYRAGLQFAPMTDEEWAQLERFLVHGGARGTGIELDQHDVLAADGSADVREEKTRREGPIKVRVDPTRREG
ncbi:MAG: hypothetical protein N2447_08030, partial [Thermoanaerobaculum sp.]|nr:hypothetical protein [Thermoanaerobaculum sp.]